MNADADPVEERIGVSELIPGFTSQSAATNLCSTKAKGGLAPFRSIRQNRVLMKWFVLV